MSRKGTCLDNAVMENVFGHLKEECFHHAVFTDAAVLIDALHDSITGYNTERISTTLKNLSPVATMPLRGMAGGSPPIRPYGPGMTRYSSSGFCIIYHRSR